MRKSLTWPPGKERAMDSGAIIKFFHQGMGRCIPVCLVMGGIFYLSHQPGDQIKLPDIINIDKVLHCFAYAVLGFSAWYAIPPQSRRTRPFLYSGVVILFCLLYGISDEVHQSFIPGRMPSIADLMADTCGGVLAAVVVTLCRRWHCFRK